MSGDSFDANLFDALHQALNREVDTDDRREDARHKFERQQLIAPYSGDLHPDQSSFHHVRCHDLSLHGFSFYSDTIPEFEHLILALGNAPFTFVIARVTRVTQAPSDSSGRYLVGCQFTRRLDSPKN